MSAGVAVRQRLLANAAVAELVVDRVYPQRAEQGCQRPFIVYRVIDEVDENAMDSGADELVTARVQVDCYADKYLDAQSLGLAVKVALVEVQSADFACWRESSSDTFEENAGEDGLHGVRADFIVQL